MQAAVGLVQLDRLARAVARRRAIAAAYRTGTCRRRGPARQRATRRYGTTNFQSFWVEVLPEFPLGRDELLERLAEDGISARRGIMAAHRQPAYAGLDTGRADLP